MRYFLRTIFICLFVNQVSIAGTTGARAQTPIKELNASAARIAKLVRAGDYNAAISIAQRARKLAENTFGSFHPEVGIALNNLAFLYVEQGRYEDAEPLYRQSLAIVENAFGRSHPVVATALNNLASLFQRQGKNRKAEKLYLRSLSIVENEHGASHPDVGGTLNNLGSLYKAQGRSAKAELYLKRSLAALEAVHGLDHSSIGAVLNNLAGLYTTQGRYDEAEPLLVRSKNIKERQLGRENPVIAASLNSLANLYYLQRRYKDAEQFHRRALSIIQAALGPNSLYVATTLNNMASVAGAQGKFGNAERLYLRALEIRERHLGRGHPDVASLFNNLAELYYSNGRFADAKSYYERSLHILSKVLGPNHPMAGTVLNNLAYLAFSQSNWADAVYYWRRSIGNLVRRDTYYIGNTLTGQSRREVMRSRHKFKGLVKAVHRLVLQSNSNGTALMNEAFHAAQWSEISQAAESLSQMSARGSGGERKLSTLVRERQDLVAQWQKRDKFRTDAWFRVAEKRNAIVEAKNLAAISSIEARITAIDQELSKDYPSYTALRRPDPISIKDAQELVGANEALVLFIDTPRQDPTPEETYLWIVTKTNVKWVRSSLGTRALTREIAALRCGLDAAAWHKEKKGKCTDLLGLTLNKIPKGNNQLPFDHQRAHKLYKALFGKVEHLITNKQLLIVPSGPLTLLPFQVLVTKSPKTNNHKSVAWLARDHAISVLPSASSLKALRRASKKTSATRPIIGFGNPLLSGHQSHPKYGRYYQKLAKSALEKQKCSSTRSTAQRLVLPIGLRDGATPIVVRGGIADLTQLRAQAPLPETADELCAVASELKADINDIHLGSRATESDLKRLSESGKLAQYRIIHFATHGALAGQLSGTTEPGLILTPPGEATRRNDGYLSASEITELKLDADWVILSACNTAAGDATSAEALSGLARAFFYAQTRALLVSHWAVSSNSTVKLITTAIHEFVRDGSIGRAEALRRAMLKLISKGKRYEGHPAYWAPFVVVGEGGAGR